MVQPSVYGTDNSCMVAALTAGVFDFRGVAVTEENIGDGKLKALYQAGVRGICINVASKTAGLTMAQGFQTLLRLARLEHVWFKLIGPYRISTEWPLHPDVAPLARALAAAAPDRCVWGTDWPHPNAANRPNDGDLADALVEWLPDAEVRQKILVDNPARLYGFA